MASKKVYSINKIYNNDCFNVFDEIEPNSINMVLVDLPYGQTACEWDITIDLNKMWKRLKLICKDNCQYVFFTTTKFGIELINSNPKWFRYDIVWEKYSSVGHLCANKMPLRNHEMIYIFNKPDDPLHDINVSHNLELREYAKNIFKYINKTHKQVKKDLGNMKAVHFLQAASTSQFSLCTEQTYNKLIELYKINEYKNFKSYEALTIMKEKLERIQKDGKTYNPQKTPGKPYKVKAHPLKKTSVYGEDTINAHANETGDRHPLSVLKFHQSGDKLHPTQKPVELCEWLIKTYSNESDNILDFCMGSGTTVIASINTKRNYIGVEKDKIIYKMADERIKKQLNNT